MFSYEQLKVLKNCLISEYGNNLIKIRDFGDSNLPYLVKTVNEARDENEIIKEIENILWKNFSL